MTHHGFALGLRPESRGLTWPIWRRNTSGHVKQSEAVPRGVLEILNGIPHGAALLDAEFRLLAMNGRLEALTGHASEDVRGIPGDHVLRSRSSHRGPSLGEAVRTRAPVTVESDVIGADRRRVPVRITASPLGQPDSSPRSILLFVEDVSSGREGGSPDGAPAAPGLLGVSPRMQGVLELVPVMARTDATLLVTGETGTGKDLLAEAVHRASRRAKAPFIKVNCGALPESLLESELFGHARGAFTGAHADKPGMFRLAQGGTIFLTEIADLPLPLQVKLLTALDDRAFYPLGSSKKVEVDVRVIAGTHRDLEDLVARGRFRQDLFFRLNVLAVRLPPLREREGDVRLLADHFLEQLSKRVGKAVKGFSPEAATVLDRYAYPGNVRELRNIAEYAVSLCRDGWIRPEHLPDYVVRGAVSSPSQVLAGDPAQGRGEGPVRPGGRPGGLPPKATWADVEKQLILEALLECRGNRGEAASRLGWGRSTLWRKMRRHGLD